MEKDLYKMAIIFAVIAKVVVCSHCLILSPFGCAEDEVARKSQPILGNRQFHSSFQLDGYLEIPVSGERNQVADPKRH
jgi:hypothetical protein